MHLWKQEYLQEANTLYSEYENLNSYNDISALRKQKNILEVLLHYKKRITFFPYSIYNEIAENNQKIVAELQNNKNYKIGILHIAEQLHSEENETIIQRIHI